MCKIKRQGTFCPEKIPINSYKQNEQMMKAKLHTFARKQILRDKHNVKPVGLYKNTS